MTKDLRCVVCCYVCLHAVLSGMRMAAPLLGLTLGNNKLAVGVLVALFALPQMLVALPAGRWADHYGLKIPIRASVVFATIGCAVAAVFPMYGTLCVAAFIVGASLATTTIALQRHIGRVALTPEQLKQGFSWLSMAPAFSNFLGPIATGLAIDHWGYPGAFVLLGTLPLTAWLWIRPVKESLKDCDKPENGERAASPWRDPSSRRVLLLGCLSAASFDLHAFVVPVLGHERGIGASVIGAILGSFAVASTLVRAFIPIVAANLREAQFITVAMASAALAFFVYPFAQSPVAMAMCSAVAGLALGGVQPMVMTLLHQVTPSHGHGRAVAMRHLAINATSIAMPMFFGAVGGIVGVSSLFWVMGFVVGLGTRLSWALQGAADRQRH